MKASLLLARLAALALAVCATQAVAQDVKGSKDHPLLTRFPGSKILYYDQREFDEHRLVNKKVSGVITKADEGNSVRVEGKITLIVYEVPKERSTLEVFNNYRQALAGANFQPLFECSKTACGRGGRESAYVRSPSAQPVLSDFLAGDDQRYAAGKLTPPAGGGGAYVSIYTMRSETGRVLAKLDIVETKEMETGLIEIDAATMRRAITDTGRVALYGIYFDTNKTDLKPESRPTLEEIAKLMSADSALRLVVVGHTDNVGTFDFNLDLSRRRAEAVVNALATQHGVQAGRLRATGASYSSPVASNRTPEGKAKNRRVELVEQ